MSYFFRALTILGVLLLLIGGCSVTKPEIYQNKIPVLTIEDYFSGHVTGHGMVQDRSGEVRRRFVVEMHGQWQGNQGILDENFVYDDGEKQNRQWKLQRLNPHAFTAIAGDVTGIAQGEQFGNAIHMTYVLQVPVGGKIYDIKMDDWLYSIDKNIVLNRATMKKFGFTVGSVTTSFSKHD